MRLIDADAIQIPKTGMEVFETCRLCETAFPKVVNEIISNAPTIEPKRGEWLPDENGDFRCTNCGRIAEWEFFEDNFCPNCGAQMKGADDDIRINR